MTTKGTSTFPYWRQLDDSYFFGIYKASSILDFTWSTPCLTLHVQSEAGKTLRTTNDQFGEAAHHKVKHFIDSHPNYNHIDKTTDEYGEAALAAVTHFNSNNI